MVSEPMAAGWDWLVPYLLEGLRPVTAAEVARLAATGGSLVQQLAAGYPPWMRALGRAWVGPERLDQLAQAGPADWQAVTDALTAARPDLGWVLWEQEAWWFRQLAGARAIFLGWS